MNLQVHMPKSSLHMHWKEKTLMRLSQSHESQTVGKQRAFEIYCYFPCSEKNLALRKNSLLIVLTSDSGTTVWS